MMLVVAEEHPAAPGFAWRCSRSLSNAGWSCDSAPPWRWHRRGYARTSKMRVSTAPGTCTVTQGCPRRCHSASGLSGQEVRCHSPTACSRTRASPANPRRQLGAPRRRQQLSTGGGSATSWTVSRKGPDLRYWTGLNAVCSIASSSTACRCRLRPSFLFPNRARRAYGTCSASKLQMDRLLENMTTRARRDS